MLGERLADSSLYFGPGDAFHVSGPDLFEPAFDLDRPSRLDVLVDFVIEALKEILCERRTCLSRKLHGFFQELLEVDAHRRSISLRVNLRRASRVGEKLRSAIMAAGL